MTDNRPKNLAEKVYLQLKEDIFDFRLLPGDRFSESEIAERMNASRTPVREALYRLERDGYVQVHFRSGWQVRPFDFHYFEDLYEVRVLLESEAVRRLCHSDDREQRLSGLLTIWCCKESQRQSDAAEVAYLDEEFHFALIECGCSREGCGSDGQHVSQTVGQNISQKTGLGINREMVAIHRGVCERLRIIRRLDFYHPGRIEATYREHGDILQKIIEGDDQSAVQALKQHIELSKNTVREITLHRIQQARQQYVTDRSMK